MPDAGAMNAIDFFTAVVCWMLGLLMASAARHKLLNWARFKASFAAYRLVPGRMVTASAALILAAEVAVSFGLFALMKPALLAAAALLMVYMVAMAINLARGRRFIDCGCGDEPAPLSYMLLARNTVLAGLAVWAALVQGGTSSLTWLAGGVALVAAVLAYGVYLSIEQLLANRARYDRLWLGVS